MEVRWCSEGLGSERWRIQRRAPLPNHNPRFAPVIHPTLKTGVEATAAAALAWLAP